MPETSSSTAATPSLAQAYTWAFGLVRRHYRHAIAHFWLTSGLLLLSVLLNVLWPYLLRDLTNLVAGGAKADSVTKAILPTAFAFAGVWLASNLMSHLRNLAASLILARMEAAFHEALYLRLLHLDYSVFLREDRDVLVGDIQGCKSAFGQLTHTLFWVMIPQFVELGFVFLILSSTVGIGFASAYALAMLALFAVTAKLAPYTDHGIERLFESNNRLVAQTVEKLAAVLDIKLNHAYAQEADIVKHRLGDYLQRVTQTNLVLGGISALSVLAMGLILLAGTIYLASGAEHGGITAGDFAMVTGYTIQLILPFLVLTSSLASLRRHRIALKRGHRYFSLPQESTGQVGIPDRHEAGSPTEDGIDVPTSDGFNLEAVTIQAGTAHRIGPITLHLPEGRVYAITGPTGAGKTHLLLALAGLYPPTSGALTFRGNPLATLNTEALRRTLAVVPQFPAIINGTVRDNLCYGLETPVNDAALAALLVRLRLQSLGDNNAQGSKPGDMKTVLDLPIGEAANRLSGGERQRIGIARALLRRPEVILLDEPSSGLDEWTEAVVMSEIVRLVRTVVIVTHRDAIVRRTDVDIRLTADGIHVHPVPGATGARDRMGHDNPRHEPDGDYPVESATI
ncbi:hypothetical protein A9404_10160 [Halothiobacillus diazotrophicus]|uniref:ABC transporter ATP-binding protein n=1 Tax=Halothiobacillus diazotrophicus TaxID=1860122 RepID=A0A191ZIG3_9GAMM|nr:ABC transporter ATP-binding protein [Halothiobacillus diazotrophicus]ANJ67691.1 hypothetical protein A9404_10160 [Halothiobacillus diazotrophicus]